MSDAYDVNSTPALPAESKQEKKENFHQKTKDEEAGVASKSVNGARCYGFALIIFGIGTVASLVPLFLEWENYTNIKSPLDEGGSPFSYELTLPIFILITALVFMIAGGFALTAYYKNKKMFGYIALVLAVIAAAVQVYAAITIKTTLEGLRIKLEGNPVSDPTFSDAEKSVLDFTGAVFNTCCVSQYDSRDYKFGNTGPLIDAEDGNSLVDDNQRPIGECLDTVEETCPLNGPNRMFPEIIDTISSALNLNLDVVLCHCYSDEARFNKFVEIIERDGLCDKYRDIIVPDADSRIVPTTGLDFGELVNALQTFRPEYSGQLPIGEFAFVGKILPPKSVYNEPSESIGWSCGLGYAKADAYYMYLWIDDQVKGPIIGSIVMAGLAVLSTILLGCFWVSGGGSNEEEVLEYGQEFNQDYGYSAKI